MKSTMKRAACVKKMLFIVSLLGAGLLVTQTAFAGVAVTKIDPARQNELLYFLKHDCGSCHGMTMKGGLGPALLPETLSAKPRSYLVTSILEGHPNTAMPPWKSMLSPDEAAWITEQLLNGNAQQSQLAKGKIAEGKLAKGKQ